MKPGDGGRLGGRWELTAPESYVLLYGPKVDSGQVLKLALLELVARGWLELAEPEEIRGLFVETRNVAVLRYGSGRQGQAGSPLDAVLELFRSVSSRTSAGGPGVPLDEFAWAARKRYDPLEDGDYAKAEVLPSLARRGLYERSESRLLGVFRTTRWEPTRAGSEARTELERNISLGEERFGEWVDKDPARALPFLGLEDLSGVLDPGAFDFDLGGKDGLDSAPSAWLFAGGGGGGC